MAKLENLRDLEQSINFKVAGALGFDPWQHPTMGTNLREPVPADPRLIPRFAPESTTPAQRGVESAELIAQAGVSARRLGVPLTLHDFPRDPAIHGGGENEDPMHSAVPLFGLRAPRWRAKEGLPPDTIPGSATYNGVPAPPAGKKGRKLYAKRAQKLKPQWLSFEAATAPKGSSSSSRTMDGLPDGPALAGPSGGSGAKGATRRGAPTSGASRTPESTGRATVEMSTSSSTSPVASAPLAPAPLASTSTSTIAPVPSPAPPPAHIPIPVPVPRPTPVPAATPIVLGGGANPSSTVEPSTASTSTASFTNSDVTHATSSSRSTSQSSDQIRSATSTAPCSPPTTASPVSTPPSLKRTRRAAELAQDEDDYGGGSPAMVAPPMRTSPEPHIKQEEEPEPHLQRKRSRRSAAPSPSPSICLAVDTRDATGGGGRPGPGQLRRSTRVARAHACATAMTTATPASRKRPTTGNGKRTTTRS